MAVSWSRHHNDSPLMCTPTHQTQRTAVLGIRPLWAAQIRDCCAITWHQVNSYEYNPFMTSLFTTACDLRPVIMWYLGQSRHPVLCDSFSQSQNHNSKQWMKAIYDNSIKVIYRDHNCNKTTVCKEKKSDHHLLQTMVTIIYTESNKKKKKFILHIISPVSTPDHRMSCYNAVLHWWQYVKRKKKKSSEQKWITFSKFPKNCDKKTT